MRRFGIHLALLLASAAAPALAAPDPKAVHAAAVVLDTHFDTPANLTIPGWKITERHDIGTDGTQVDYPRMVEGGVDGGFFAIFTPQGERGAAGNAKARDDALARAALIHRMVDENPKLFGLALKASDVGPILKSGRRFVFVSMENGSPVAGDLSLMKAFYDRGVRMMGPVHFLNNDLADSATDPKGPEWGGLSPQGKAFVAEANRLGVVLDASHASDQVLDQMLALSKAPIILSHSGVKAVYPHPRNIDDDWLRALAAKGGVIQINAFSGYMKDIPKIPEREAALAQLAKDYGPARSLTPERRAAMIAARKEIDAKWPVPRADLDDLMAHIDHAVKVAGIDHVGLSGDFDGGGGINGLDSVVDYPRLTERLLAAGYSPADIAKFWGGNALRVLAEVEKAKGK